VLLALALVDILPAVADDPDSPALSGASQPVVPFSATAPAAGSLALVAPMNTLTEADARSTAGEPALQKADAEKSDDVEKKDGEKSDEVNPETIAAPQNFNFHSQLTAVAQGDPGFPAQYSGPNSLNSVGERQSTFSADLFAGLRLWRGAEMHADFMMWEGYGLSQTFGIEDFPNGDAYKAGTTLPDFTAAHLFIRQTFGFGGEQEDEPDGPLSLAGKQDISRLTVTVGRLAVSDIFDNNTYAHDPHTQFLNWAAAANLTWDYPADTIGFTTGLAVELNQPDWTLRYGFFQMPGVQNGFTAEDRIFTWPGQGGDGPFFLSWGMVTELERRWKIDSHPGAIRLMAWLNEANMANYSAATALLLANPPSNLSQGTDDTPDSARSFRCKYGFGLNWEQEVAKNIGMFSRVGWNDGQEESWAYTEATWTTSLGVSVKGPLRNLPKRQDDTFGLMGVISGTSHANQEFLQAGGLGILDGDGALSYSPEKALETYYNFQLEKTAQLMLDYQFVADPSFNCARGPVSIFGARIHWEF
jgi:high affinity Mn2+ porin